MLQMTPNRSDAVIFVFERFSAMNDGYAALRDSQTGKYVRFYCWSSYVGLHDVVSPSDGHFWWKRTADNRIINPSLIHSAFNITLFLPGGGYVKAEKVDFLGHPPPRIELGQLVPTADLLPTNITVEARTNTATTGFTFKFIEPTRSATTFTIFEGTRNLGTATTEQLSFASGHFMASPVSPDTTYTFRINHQELVLRNQLMFKSPAASIPDLSVTQTIDGLVFKGTPNYNLSFTLFEGSTNLGSVTPAQLSSASGHVISRSVTPNTSITYTVRSGSTIVGSATLTTNQLRVQNFTATQISIGATNGFIFRATPNYRRTFSIVLGSELITTASFENLSSSTGVFVSRPITQGQTYTFTIRYENVILATTTATLSQDVSGPIVGSPSVRVPSGPRVSSGVGGDILYYRTIDAAGDEGGNGVACDSSGNVYFAGFYNGLGPTIKNQVGSSFGTLPAGSGPTGFLSKFDSTGKYMWSRLINTFGETFDKVTCDADDNVYVCGESGNGVPVIRNQSGATIQTLFNNAGAGQAFLCKFNSSGDHIWSRILDGTGTERIKNITCDSFKNVYVSGHYTGTPAIKTQLNQSMGTLPTSTASTAFVAKFDSSGNYIWARILDGTGFDEGLGIACDSLNNIYVTGFYSGKSTIKTQTGSGMSTIPFSGPNSVGNAVFVSKFTSSGDYQWSRTIDSEGNDRGNSIACDSLNNVYVTGSYVGTAHVRNENGVSLRILPVPRIGSVTFVTKFDSSGNYGWSRVIDSEGNDDGLGVTCDLYDTVYISGSFTGLRNAHVKNEAGEILKSLPWFWNTGFNALVTAFRSDGTYIYSRIINAGGGAAGDEKSISVATDSYGDVYFVGDYPGNPIISNDNGEMIGQLTSATGRSAFLIKMYGPPGTKFTI
jgi:hypothetical protein